MTTPHQFRVALLAIGAVFLIFTAIAIIKHV